MSDSIGFRYLKGIRSLNRFWRLIPNDENKMIVEDICPILNMEKYFLIKVDLV